MNASKMISIVGQMREKIDKVMATFCLELIEDGMNPSVTLNLAISSYMSSMLELVHNSGGDNLDRSIEKIKIAITALHEEYKEKYPESFGETIN